MNIIKKINNKYLEIFNIITPLIKKTATPTGAALKGMVLVIKACIVVVWGILSTIATVMQRVFSYKNAFLGGILFTVKVCAIYWLLIQIPELHRYVLTEYAKSKVVAIYLDYDLTNPEKSKENIVGTGFYITAPSNKTYILTNRHICNKAKDDILYVAPYAYNKVFSTKILKISLDRDLCLMESVGDIKGFRSLRDASSIDKFHTLGHPHAQQLTYFEGFMVGWETSYLQEIIHDVDDTGHRFTIEECLSYRNGKVAIFASPLFYLVKVCVTVERSITTTIPTAPGQSGSPVFDNFGRIIGVIFATSNNLHFGSIIPAEFINEFLKDL